APLFAAISAASAFSRPASAFFRASCSARANVFAASRSSRATSRSPASVSLNWRKFAITIASSTRAVASSATFSRSSATVAWFSASVGAHLPLLRQQALRRLARGASLRARFFGRLPPGPLFGELVPQLLELAVLRRAGVDRVHGRPEFVGPVDPLEP